MTQPDIPIILASQSQRRRKLLKQIGIHFRIIPSNSEEIYDYSLPPAKNVQLIALKKATDVAHRLRKGIVIGADTIVIFQRHVLGKPKSPAEAVRMLQLLSGKSHFVYTGIALVDVETNLRFTTVEKTEVHFRKLSEKEIKDYVASGSPLDKAGAYGIQDDYGAVFVERINGCYYNVVGFPLARFSIVFPKFLRERDKILQMAIQKNKPNNKKTI